MKVFRPGLPPVFTDEDAAEQPPKVPTPAEKAAGVGIPFLTPEQAKAAADARHAASIPVEPVKPEEKVVPTAPSPNPGASGAPATTQIIPPVAPQPLIDKTAEPNPAPAAISQPESKPSTVLTPEEEAELDALLAKRGTQA